MLDRVREVKPDPSPRAAIRAGSGPAAQIGGDTGFGLSPPDGMGRLRQPATVEVASTADEQRADLSKPNLGPEPGSKQWEKQVQQGVDKIVNTAIQRIPRPKAPSAGQTIQAYRNAQWKQVENVARKYLGVRYVWGGTNPKSGLDCSGYTQLVFRQLGVNLPRVSRQQARVGLRVTGGWAKAVPGDLVFYARGGTVYHVGIYAGMRNGRPVMYNAPRRGDVVKLSYVATRNVSNIQRVLPSGPPAQAGPVRRGKFTPPPGVSMQFLRARGYTGQGWQASLDPYEAYILARESSFRTTADNPRSTAFGLGQLLYANRVNYGRRLGIRNPNTTDVNDQLRMFRLYVRSRYGNSRNAYNFWRSRGWY